MSNISSALMAQFTQDGVRLEPKEKQRLEKATEEFETLFMEQMLKSMRSTIKDEDGLIKKGKGEELFSEMLDKEYAKMASQGDNGLGLKDVLMDHLVKDSNPVAGATKKRANQLYGEMNRLISAPQVPISVLAGLPDD